MTYQSETGSAQLKRSRKENFGPRAYGRYYAKHLREETQEGAQRASSLIRDLVVMFFCGVIWIICSILLVLKNFIVGFWDAIVWYFKAATKRDRHILHSICASMLGVAFAFTSTAHYSDMRHYAANGKQAFQKVAVLENWISDAQPKVKLANEVEAGIHRVTPLQADGPLAMMIASESNRLGCTVQPLYVTGYFSANRTIESSGRVQVAHEITLAYGLYAFKPASVVDTARRGGIPYTKKHWGVTPQWIIDLAQGDGTNVNLREDQWKVLVLLHAIIRPGSDASLKGALCEGSMDSAKTLYSEFHHTNVDAATVKRMNKYFKSIWPKNLIANT